MENAPKRARTSAGIPGDPLNVALVGTEAEVIRALLAAKWYPADPITLKSSLAIAASVLLHRPDPEAPVSNLYLWGRKQDLAFERPAGESAKRRHHVRLWKSEQLGMDGRPLWIGSATFDKSVGVSRYTGQITHHISADIDSERDTLIQDLKSAGQLVEIYQVTGIGPTIDGRNGEGDWYFTDGELTVGVIAKENAVQTKAPETLVNPAAVRMKNKAWSLIKNILLQPAVFREARKIAEKL